MLTELYPQDALQTILIPKDQWRPFAKVREREAWQALPGSVREAHILRGEQAQQGPWPILPASLFLEFVRDGNRSRYEKESFGRRRRLTDLVLAEAMEGQGRFMDAIADGIWAICEETYWGVPAHVGMQKAGSGLPDVSEPTMDLFVGETVGLLAWCHYLLSESMDAVSPLLGPRIVEEAQRRVLSPCLKREDFWWMGFESDHVNNWNPWCNANWLTAALLLEADDERLLQAVRKILASLDRFIGSYPEDGGCDEGPGYWTRAAASLFDGLELLHSASAGRIDIFGQPLIAEMGRYIHRAHITDRYFINFADAPPLLDPPGSLIFRYGKKIQDDPMMRFGAWWVRDQDLLHRGTTEGLGRALHGLFGLSEALAAEASPHLRDSWLPQTQIMIARDQAGSSKGFFVAAKAGHNGESHNHNDVGHFIVYGDGEPVLIDAGVETYTAKTFSASRYEIWTMQSAFHHVPTLDGVMQMPGRQFAAKDVSYSSDEAVARLRMDLAGAYPDKVRPVFWMRTVTFYRLDRVTIKDTFRFPRPPRELTWGLLTPCEVDLARPGVARLMPVAMSSDRSTGSAQVTYDADRFSCVTEEILLEDEKLRACWGPRLTRIVLKRTGPPAEETWLLTIRLGAR